MSKFTPHFRPKGYKTNAVKIKLPNRVDEIKFKTGGIDPWCVSYFSGLHNGYIPTKDLTDAYFMLPSIRNGVSFEDVLEIRKYSSKGLLVGRPLAEVTEEVIDFINYICKSKYGDKAAVKVSLMQTEYGKTADRNKCMVNNGKNHEPHIPCKPSILGDMLKVHAYYLAKEKFVEDFPNRDQRIQKAVDYGRKTSWDKKGDLYISKITNEQIPHEEKSFADFMADIIERDIGITRDG